MMDVGKGPMGTSKWVWAEAGLSCIGLPTSCPPGPVAHIPTT